MLETSPVVVIAVALWMAAGLALLGKIILSMVRRSRAGTDVPPHEGPLIGGVAALTMAPLAWLLAGAEADWAGMIPAIIGALCLGAWLSGRRHARTKPADGTRGMSFREKSAAIVLLTNLAVFGTYFLKTWDASLSEAVPIFFKSVGLSISVLIGAHILVAVHSRSEDVDRERDERDKLIDLFSTRNAHYVLLVGAWIIPVLALMQFAPLLIANSALAVLVCSGIVLHGSQVAYYRFGV